MRLKTKSKKLRVFLVLLVVALAVPLWFVGIVPRPMPRLGSPLRPVGMLRQPELAEASGLVQGYRDPGLFWLHNDSGDVARIFALTVDGEVVGPPGGLSVSNASNVDWEDITRIDDRLYIADLGNNLNRRRDLGIYEVPEPDPRSVSAVAATAFYPVVYKDQQSFPPNDRWDFDCEAVFAWLGKLYVVTKTRPPYRVFIQGSAAQLYRLDRLSSEESNVLVRVDDVADLGGWVTAADTSHDGRYLALLVESPVQSVWLFERPRQGDRFFSNAASTRRFVFHDGGQLESLAFFYRPSGSGEGGPEEIVMINEDREIFRVSLDMFRAVEEEKPTPVQTKAP